MKLKTDNHRSCFHCTETFLSTAKWQIFCGNACKDRWNSENFDSCFYCGELATDRDHILPVSSRGGKRQFSGQETVRSCKECNVVLGSNMFTNIFDRLDFLIKKYKVRYKLNKPAIRWSEEELNDLGRTLRTAVEREQRQRQFGEDKVVFLRYRKLELYHELDDFEKEELFEDRALPTSIEY